MRKRGRPKKEADERAQSLTVRLYHADRLRLDALKSRWAMASDSEVIRASLEKLS